MSLLTTDSITLSDLAAQQILASLELAAPQLDGYEIIDLIGEGTYGEVWRARETASGVIVAIKRFRDQPSEKCCAEVEHLAKLSAARGIVALRKVHLQSEPYCYVMEHLPGGTLADLLRSGGSRPFREAWEKFRRLTEAMCYVHRDGLVHGDIKPENILLDSAGYPRICDFGQARASRSHVHVFGTPYYMPPEQARLEGLPDPRWDVYALGAILFEMLTGTKPRFDAATAKMLTAPTSSGTEARTRLEQYARNLEKIPHVDVHRHVEGVDGSVAKLVDRCLSLEFDERPTDATAVLHEIEMCERTRRGRPLFIFGGIAPAILLLALGILILVGGRRIMERATERWKNNIMHSNLAIAQAISESIGDSFDQKLAMVQRSAKSLPSRDNKTINENLENLYRKYKEQIHRWSFIDSNGIMQANFGRIGKDESPVGPDAQQIKQNYSWRAFFHGGLKDDDKEDVGKHERQIASFSRRKLLESYIGQPFWRISTPQYAVIAVSCPTGANGDIAPDGLLSGTFLYHDLVKSIEKFEKRKQGEQRRQVIVLNDRRQFIYDSHMVKRSEEVDAAASNKERSEMTKDKLSDLAPELEHLAMALADDSDNGAVLGSYYVPNEHKRYIGSSAPIKLENKQKFAVIVQQEEELALQPIRDLRSAVNGFAIALVIVGILFLAINTYALYWFLRHQQQSAAYV